MKRECMEVEQLRSELTVLVAHHRKTRLWFWRTGAASLSAAGLWILIYTFASDNAGVKESLAIIVGAFLMWLLFLWAFLVLRKLNRLTAQVRVLEKKLIHRLAETDSQPEIIGRDPSTD